MDSSKTKQIKPAQFEILVDFMKSHSDLSKGQLTTANAKSSFNNLWENIAMDLNAAGPPTRITYYKFGPITKLLRPKIRKKQSQHVKIWGRFIKLLHINRIGGAGRSVAVSVRGCERHKWCAELWCCGVFTY